VNEILALKGRTLSAEWIACVRRSWMLQDQLTGLARVGNGRWAQWSDRSRH
jgi:hypothetical protein